MPTAAILGGSDRLPDVLRQYPLNDTPHGPDEYHVHSAMPAQGVVSGTALVFGEGSRRLALQKESKVDEWRLAADHVYMLLSIPPKYDDNLASNGDWESGWPEKS